MQSICFEVYQTIPTFVLSTNASMMDKKTLLTVFADQQEEIESNELESLCSRPEEDLFDLNSKLAQVVIGVRRSGKSTLCEKALKQSGVDFAYANFDDDRLVGMTTGDFDGMLDALYQLYGDFQYLYLDEMQNIEGWQLFVNRMLRRKIHVVITGSNANLLSSDLMTHLTGRYNEIVLYPFSFVEYSTMKGVDLHSPSTKHTALRKRAFKEYLEEGGFPELLTEKNRRQYVDTLFNNIIKKDICKRFKIRYPEIMLRMATYLADNFCQEFIASSVGKILGISDHTAENYYSYLKQAFLLLGVRKFSYKSSERISHEKVYVVDTAFVSDREGTFSTENLGWRLENDVYIELRRRNKLESNDVFYYRCAQWEVDFMVTYKGEVKQLIQVSYDISSPKTLKREIRGLIYGAKKFNCNDLILINNYDDEVIEQDGYTIKVVSAADWFAGNS